MSVTTARRWLMRPEEAVLILSTLAACGDEGTTNTGVPDSATTTADETTTIGSDSAKDTPTMNGDDSPDNGDPGNGDDGAVGDESDAPVTTEPDETESTKSPETSAGTSSTDPDPFTAPGGSDADDDPALQPLVDQAKDHLAGRLGVATEAITVVSAEMVQWPDAANGCPQPGMSYAQVVSDGPEIVPAPATRRCSAPRDRRRPEHPGCWRWSASGRRRRTAPGGWRRPRTTAFAGPVPARPAARSRP